MNIKHLNSTSPMMMFQTSLVEHNRMHFSKMIVSLIRILNILTSGDLGDLLSPDERRQQWLMLSFNALEHLLPRRQLTAEELADTINKRYYLRQMAKKSHARHSQVARE